MASSTSGTSALRLERLPAETSHQFTTPSKTIHDGDDLTFFLSSTAYRDLMTWILQLNRSMFPSKEEDGKINESRLTSPPVFSQAVQHLQSLITNLSDLIEQAPPDTGPRRFGNVAFRTWVRLVEDNADRLLEENLPLLLSTHAKQSAELKDELKFYLIGSFGSAQRLDYGTGHELSFLAFLGCLWKLDALEEGEERAIVVGVVQPYLELIRRLVLTYTLEPAGSHGVWGLDDHSFIPYIFGSAQYGLPIDPSKISQPVPTEGSLRSAPSPSKITDRETVSDYKDSNMYFSAIQFIYDVKRGPFWEHSPVLYDVSGIKDGWSKINKGMLKMYAAEVLGKFPVVQHFGFGSLFRWEADPEAVRMQSSLHAQQQPAKATSMDVPPAPSSGSAGTKAPWAGQSGAMTVPRIPSTTAPWSQASRNLPPGMTPAAASRPPAQREPPGGPGMAPTRAPWAKKDGSGQ